jgi:catechol 2,3-dioxygenase-like lactoylglutathione lyase family enzyme
VFDHVTIRVADREASEAFYTTVLQALGVRLAHCTAE